MVRLIKSPKDLPEWFPLETYIRDLNEHQWLEELVLRRSAKTILENTGDRQKVTDIFTSLVLSRSEENVSEKSALLEEIKHVSEMWGVREIPPFYVAYLGCMLNEANEGRELTEYLTQLRKGKVLGEFYSGETPELIERAQKEGINNWVEWGQEPFQMQDVLPQFPVVVDLDQDDETLKLAFEIWLAGVRSKTGEAPKPVSKKDFEHWKKYGLLPVFDLLFWAELNQFKYTDALIANAVWPDTYVDNAERLRKVSKPKVDQIFDNWMFINRFWRQLELSESLELIMKENRNEKG